MEVQSLGYRTDLALLRLGGSQVEDRGDCLVVRTPHNPSYWWGNFLLLQGVPPLDQTGAWLERFAAELPEVRHVAMGFDGRTGRLEDLAGFTAAGLSCEASTVLSASAVHEPPRPNRGADYRALQSDADWAQSLDLFIACNDGPETDAAYRTFAERRVATNRALVEAGHGGWFGAFLDGRLVSQLGLVTASAGLARFQAVETHPDARGRGLAGSLVHHVSQVGFERFGARTLVMVADPDYLAVRVYRSVGFVDGEVQLQGSRAGREGPKDKDAGYGARVGKGQRQRRWYGARVGKGQKTKTLVRRAGLVVGLVLLAARLCAAANRRRAELFSCTENHWKSTGFGCGSG